MASASPHLSWRQLSRFLGGSRRLFIAGATLATFDALGHACIPLFFRQVLNGIETDAQAFLAHDFWPTMWVGVGIIFVFLPSAYFFHVLLNLAIMRFCRNLQVELYRHIQGLSVDFFQRYQIGEINARLNGDLESVAQAAGPLSAIVWAPWLLVASLVFMFLIDVPLTLICILMLGGVSYATVVAMPRLRRWNRRVRDASGEASATITEYVGLFGLVKAFSREDYAEDRVRTKSDDLLKRREEVTWYQHVFTDVMQTFTKFGAPFVILSFGTYWIVDGDLKSGDLVAFWGYWMQLAGVVQALVMSFSAVMGAMAATDRLLAFFAESPRVKDPHQPQDLRTPLRGAVEFRDLHFRYPVADDDEGPVLHGVNLKIAPGENVALVGPSGAGKSTLLQLLLRFYDPDAGAIYVDGVDIRELNQATLRNEMGLVMQESLFFAGTIADNLRLAKPGATVPEMWDALEAANAADFVREFPRQLEAALGERGAKLSGGQKQRLAIARTFLKNPPLLLLDEPTSALDAASEQRIKDAMKRLLKGRTSIIVAHRLATIMDADRIVVLEQGRIAAIGKHADLQQTSPLYAELCRHQGLAVQA
ncbi:MAG: ABC transporter-like protein [Puniceicoccaceae bacterium 5H]|nr:MAG: ABC transporter-like protein [Puniceicoccaceae bacterium 5H]